MYHPLRNLVQVHHKVLLGHTQDSNPSLHSKVHVCPIQPAQLPPNMDLSCHLYSYRLKAEVGGV